MKPRILAIDTSAALCSVALSNGAQQFFTTSVSSRRHADELLGMIQSMLAESGQQLSDLDAIAVVSGPGSFTGLRIGLAVAQGLAFGSDKDIVMVSSLAMLARNAARQKPDNKSPIAVLMPAREQEYYLGVYDDPLAELSVCLTNDQLIDAADVKSALQAFSAQFPDEFLLAGSGWCLLGIEGAVKCDPPANASDLLSLALQKYHESGALAPELASLSYLKDELPYRTVEQQ
jgi:tRNA threonylcarbamoyladenosine biosynthesis protein TsaB